MTPSRTPGRKPHAVAADDPSVAFETGPDTSDDASTGAAAQHNQAGGAEGADDGSVHGKETLGAQAGPTIKRGIKWGALLVSAMAGLAALAASLSFASFVAHVLARDDWIGWLGFALAALAGLAFTALALRELIGLVRLSRLSRLRSSIAKALRNKDLVQERAAVQRLSALYQDRDDLKWPLARLKDHHGDIRDAGELLRLADREVIAPLDIKARALILKSAKRVTVATAISPMVWMAMLYVVAENLRLIKGLATLYGARPGGVGAVKLARMVFTHILATGGLALTDDLLGQFLGQDLIRRLSRRLGEGVFNGALTARVGTAAVAVTRPLPFLDAPPLRLRDIMRELARTTVKSKA